MKTVYSIATLWVVLAVVMLVGWFTNLVWLFKFTGETTAEFFIALLGVAVAPLGVFHGWVTFF